jgi:glycerol-3-phosphate dehydrogenase
MTVNTGQFKELSAKHWDLLVIGGGIQGAGVAREAALKGLSVLLAEKEDFGFGTSSRSTKLIHGGLRYLEHYEFKLVWESLHERFSLLKDLAPHLVRPLPFNPLLSRRSESALADEDRPAAL